MIGIHVFARLREQALFVRTGTVGHLFFACRVTEVCGRTADIVDISFKSGSSVRSSPLLKRFMAAHLNDPALVEGQGAEAAAAKASPVTDEAEFNLRDGGNSACLLVGGDGSFSYGRS